MQKYIIRNSLIAAGLLLAPMAVNAAGLGNLSVTSALGQPLRAEAVVLADPKEDVSSFVAHLASQDAYREAKIDRAAALLSLKFSIEKKATGQVYLKITSAQPINDPFLDMLIELSWSSGRLLREYSVLLDPPGYGESQTAAPIAVPLVKALPEEQPAKAAAASEVVAPAAAPAKGVAKPEARPAAKPARAEAKKLTPAEQTFPKAEAEKPQQPVSAQGKQEGKAAETYVVKKGDTLSKIATEMKPEGINLDQMLVGLYQSNKRAFAGDNMNRLKTGQILRVPESEKLAAVDKAEAAKEIRVHSADWNAYRQKLAAAVASAEPEKEKVPSQAASGKIAKAEDKAAVKAEPAKDVLKLSKGEAPGAAKGGAAGTANEEKQAKALQDRIHALQEESTAKEKTIKEAGSRIAELEKNIKEMQKLLDVKSQNLADLQKQAAAAKAPPPAPVVAAKPAPAPVAAPAQPVPEKPVPEAKQEPLVKAIPEQKVPEAQPVPAPKPAAPAKPVAKPKPVVAQEQKPEPSWYEAFLDNPLYLAGGAGAALLAGLLGLMLIGNKRKKSLTSFEDSIMTGGDLKLNTVLGDTAGGVIDTGDTSFLTDFSQAGLGTIDTNDVDPIAEAEVYMAYGRDAQAEEILKEAMSKDPNRHEIQLKLLEIYASRKNLVAFETLASELYAAIAGKPSTVWEKAAEMGRELDPNNPLYAGGGAAKRGAAEGVMAGVATGMAAAAGAAERVAEEPAADLDLGEVEDMTQHTAPDLEFNVDADILSSVGEEESISEVEVQDEGVLDFDLGLPEPEPDIVAEIASPSEEEKDEDEGVLDFDLGLPSAEPEVVVKEEVASSPAEEEAVMQTPSMEDMGLDFDMDTIISQAVEKKSAEPQEERVTKTEMAEDTNEFDLERSLALDLKGEEVAEQPVEESIVLAAPSEENTLDFDFRIEDEPHMGVELEQPTQTMPDLDLSGISLDLDESPTIATHEEVADAGGDQWHEVATKLDLAKAYVEMGDREGAREILQEVVQEGDQQQQTDAKALLAELV